MDAVAGDAASGVTRSQVRLVVAPPAPTQPTYL